VQRVQQALTEALVQQVQLVALAQQDLLVNLVVRLFTTPLTTQYTQKLFQVGTCLQLKRLLTPQMK
jgi:hypothetical protein